MLLCFALRCAKGVAVEATFGLHMEFRSIYKCLDVVRYLFCLSIPERILRVFVDYLYGVTLWGFLQFFVFRAYVA